MKSLYLALAACSFNPTAQPDGAPTPAIDASLIDAPDAAPVTSCPSSYTSVGTLTSKYRVSTDSAMWADAEAACEADGAAHLVVLTDMAEALELAPTTGVQTWIGIDDLLVNGAFRAVTDETPFLPWMSGQPKNDAASRCVVLHDDGANVGLIDPHKCSDTHPYICECDFRLADPTSF